MEIFLKFFRFHVFRTKNVGKKVEIFLVFYRWMLIFENFVNLLSLYLSLLLKMLYQVACDC
jgi:hypothetical protein